MIQTLHDLLPRIKALSRQEAVLFDNGFRTWTYSYADLLSRAASFSNFLARHGLKKGDRIVLWSDNSLEWMAVFWGAVLRGVALVPVDAGFSPQMVEKILARSGASLLFYGERGREIPADLPQVSLAGFRWDDYSGDPVPVPVDPDDVVEIVFTSGTTGTPQGVIHRHRNLAANLEPFGRETEKHRLALRAVRPLRTLNLLPLSHMFGQVLGLFLPVLLQGSVVFSREMSPGGLTRLIRRRRISAVAAVPRVITQMTRYVEGRFGPKPAPAPAGWMGIAWRWWRFRQVHRAFGWKFWALVAGGARVDSRLEKFWKELGFAFIQGYGLTEASPVVTLNHPLRSQEGSIGKVIGEQEVRIAPDGEILVRGPNVTTESLGPEGLTTRGGEWLHTGDIGEMDEEGYLYYRGRKKDVIVTGEGQNVFPEDVESILNRLSAVREAAVVPKPSPEGETVHAVLVLETGCRPQEVIRETNRQLEPHQRIRSWSLWPEDELPRTPSTHKVQRSVIAGYVAERADQPPVRRHSAADPLVQEIRQVLNNPQLEVGETSSLAEDLGVTSLERVALMSRLEIVFSIDLDEIEFTSAETVQQIRGLLERTGVFRQNLQPEGGIREERSAAEPAGPTSPASPAMPRWNHRVPLRAFRALFREVLALPLFRHYITVTVVGANHLRAWTPPLLFAMNHTSHLDALALLAALPRHWRSSITPAILQERFRHYLDRQGPWKSRLKEGGSYYLALALFNAYPLPQKVGGIRRVLRYSAELADRGLCPLIFPEGRRTPTGKMLPLMPGAALMSSRLQLPIVPVYSKGLFEVMSVDSSWPQRGEVTVVFGRCLRPRPDEEVSDLTARLSAEFQRLEADAPGSD